MTRGRSLPACCALLIGCGRAALVADGGVAVIDANAGDAPLADAPRGDAPLADAPGRETPGGDVTPGNATWSAWPLISHDPANTRRSPNVGPQAPVERYAIDLVTQQVVIGVDGTLYATDWGGAYPVLAFDPATGARLWSFQPTPSVPTTVAPFYPAIAAGPEGNVYAAYRQGGFYALDRDGSVRWQFTTGKTGPTGDLSAFERPLVGSDGRVYVGESSVLHVFEADGRRAWQFDAGSIEPVSAVALGPDGTVYVTEDYGALHALGRDGAARWTLPVSNALTVIAAPVVRDDGTLLFAVLGERQFGAVDASGAILWQKPGSFTGFALASDSGPAVGDVSGVSRMDRTGSTVWQAEVGGHDAIIDGAGTVYTATAGSIFAVDATGIVKWELVTADPAIAGSAATTPSLYALGGDGTLYAGVNGRIHAIGGGGPCEGKPVDCDDHDPCTVDRCDPTAGCVHAPKCVSPGVCTSARCAADGACTFTPAPDGTACDDGIACSQGDACQAGQCAASDSACALAGAWPTGGHDARRTSATSLLGPGGPTPKWSSPGPALGAFVIAEDGTIYATDGTEVLAISADGVATPFASVAAADLVLRRDGGLYATWQSQGSGLSALDAGGMAQWSFDMPEPLWAPVLGASGALYVSTRFDLFALAPDGSTLWDLPTGGTGTRDAPAVGPDGTVYALCPDLWAIAADGRVKWKRPVGWARGLVVGPTGAVHVLLDGGVHTIDANGTDLWSWSLTTSATFAAALSADGELVLVAGPTLWRLDAATGAQRASLTLPTPANTALQLTPPVLDGDDVLYVAGNATDTDSFAPLTTATLYAIDRSDQVLWSTTLERSMNARAGNLAIGPDRTLYLTLDGRLLAISP